MFIISIRERVDGEITGGYSHSERHLRFDEMRAFQNHTKRATTTSTQRPVSYTRRAHIYDNISSNGPQKFMHPIETHQNRSSF